MVKLDLDDLHKHLADWIKMRSSAFYEGDSVMSHVRLDLHLSRLLKEGFEEWQVQQWDRSLGWVVLVTGTLRECAVVWNELADKEK